jgi:hypothetical protein
MLSYYSADYLLITKKKHTITNKSSHCHYLKLVIKVNITNSNIAYLYGALDVVHHNEHTTMS